MDFSLALSSFGVFIGSASLSLLTTVSAAVAIGLLSEKLARKMVSRNVITCIKQCVCKTRLRDCLARIAPMWKFQCVFYIPPSIVLTLNGSEIRPID